MIYINGCLKKNYRNIALLDLFGKSQRQKTVFYLMIAGVIFAIPLGLSLILAYPVSYLSSLGFISFILAKEAAIISRWQSYLAMLATVIGLVLIFSPIAYLIGRNKTLRYLKDE